MNSATQALDHCPHPNPPPHAGEGEGGGAPWSHLRDTLFRQRSASRRPAAARALLSLLANIRGGRLALTLPDGDCMQLGSGSQSIEVQVRDWHAFDAVLAAGDIGFADAYMDGQWDTPELPRLLTLLAHNRDTLQRAIFGQAWRLLPQRLLHRLRANTRSGSRRNVAAHYDLGNDFYRLWLDEGMTYSSALFAADDARSLEQAQAAKYRRILDRLGLRPGQEILEIGCGWGACAEIAAKEYGARVLGLTLSRRQLEYARQRARDGGFADRARFELRDYRDACGRYDHIVSIEMFEAVGERYWPLYFRRLGELLRPGGGALIQTITIADAHFARYRSGTDFIQRYIFPGGMLPAPGRFTASARRAGFAVADDLAFGPDYARTLALWLERFDRSIAAVRALGYGARFERMWRLYLAYCEAGFRSGSTDVHQYHLVPVRP